MRGQAAGHELLRHHFAQFADTGPFTQVPLPDRRSSLVWVVPSETAEELALLDDAPLLHDAHLPGDPAHNAEYFIKRARKCCTGAAVDELLGNRRSPEPDGEDVLVHQLVSDPDPLPEPGHEDSK